VTDCLVSRMHGPDARMTLARNLIILCLLALTANAVTAQNSSSAIRGALIENRTAISEASVFLQSLDDEACAKVFAASAQDRESAKRLKSCVHDVSTASPDTTGRFEFTNVRAGWYVVHFLWNIGTKPSSSMHMFNQGQWAVMYGGQKDSTGRYDTMAQDAPFYFSATEDAIRNFEITAAQEPKPLRGRLSLASKDWGVVLDLPGFTVRVVETNPDGSRYMAAENKTTRVVVSLTLVETKSAVHVRSCREALEEKTKNNKLKIRDVRFSRSGDVDFLRYMVPEFSGQPFNQGSLFACESYDDTYIHLHVSKVNYTTADESSFADVFNSLKVEKIERPSQKPTSAPD
jgi:hypothetical protein